MKIVNVILISEKWKINCKDEKIYLSYENAVLIDNAADFVKLRHTTNYFIEHSIDAQKVDLEVSNNQRILLSKEELIQLNAFIKSFEARLKDLGMLSNPEKCFFTAETGFDIASGTTEATIKLCLN
jgi:hypothetical protein